MRTLSLLALVACAETVDDTATDGPDPFADALVSFDAGSEAGFGQADLPDVVLGPPRGAGDLAGSLHVVSLGRDGEIVVELVDWIVVDGPGADLVVFENPFSGFVETGHVAVSDDGVTWFEWPCDPTDAPGGYPGCAGVEPVFASPDSEVGALDAEAGGDAFDLADLGIATARYVRIRDSGFNEYLSPSGGFDLDAVVAVNGDYPTP